MAWSTWAGAAPSPNSFWDNRLSDTWNSPAGNYSITISQAADDPFHSERLTLCQHKKQLAQYGFDGTLVSIYWSSGENYVAINNHEGHRAWRVWILSLRTGQLIRVGGPPPATISLDTGNPLSKFVPYDFYLDYKYLPDVLAFAEAQIISVYPSFVTDEDRRGGGHIGVIYGWKNANTLLKFDSVQMDNLNEQRERLSISTLLHVTPKGLYLSNAIVHKTPLASCEGRSPEVRRILGAD